MAEYIEVLDPTCQPRRREGQLAPRPESLRGLRVGLLDNAKGNADVLLHTVQDVLRADYGVQTFVMRRKETSTRGATFLPEFAREIDVLVNALGD